MWSPHPLSLGLINQQGHVTRVPALLKRCFFRDQGFTPFRCFVRLWCARKALRSADVFVAAAIEWAIALKLLKMICGWNQEIIAITIGPFSAPRTWKQKLLKPRLLSDIHKIFLGQSDYQSFRRHVLDDPQRSLPLFFGTDVNYWRPDPVVMSEDYAFSVGSESRDYSTLLSAWKSIDRPLRILTSCDLSHYTLPEGVTRMEGQWSASTHSDDGVRSLILRARYVVIALHESTRPVGQSCILQAMACARPLIVSRIEGLWEPSKFQHLENCYLVNPADPEAIQAAVAFLDSHPEISKKIGINARSMVISYFTSAQFCAILERQLTSLAGRRGAVGR